MNQVIERIESRLNDIHLAFARKPVVIGGMAMEYYGMRKAGADIDLVISNEDYLALAGKHPDKLKDIYGDLGVVINEFEIWRSIALLDYDFFAKDAASQGSLLVVSLDRLLFMRVCAMDVEKYKKDLITMKEYYFEHFRNKMFLHEAETHAVSYVKSGGTVFGGKYMDE
jgi:hypothetical protein